MGEGGREAEEKSSIKRRRVRAPGTEVEITRDKDSTERRFGLRGVPDTGTRAIGEHFTTEAISVKV